MDNSTIWTVGVALFAIIGALQTVATIKAIRRIRRQREAEQRFQLFFKSVMGESHRRLRDELGTSPKVELDRRAYEELRCAMMEAYLRLEPMERLELSEGACQPSPKGRIKYLEKLVADTVGERAAVAIAGGNDPRLF